MRRYLSVIALSALMSTTGAFAESHAFDPASEAAVLEIQQKLQGLGFDPGTPDGKMGRNTRNAIRAFEKSRGFTPTGEITVELRALLDGVIALEAEKAAVAAAVAAYRSGDLDAFEAELANPDVAAAFAKHADAGKALRKAVANERIGLSKQLIDLGLVEAASTRTPPLVHIALAKKNPELLQLVARAVGPGEGLEASDGQGMPPLLRALMDERPDAAKMLIAAGADANNAKFRGVTALHISAWWGYEDVSDQLIAAGADLTLRDKARGMTAMEVALSQGHFAVAKALQDAGAVLAEDSPALEPSVSIIGMFGNHGYIEFAQEFSVSRLAKTEAGFDRVALSFDTGADDKFLRVILPEAKPQTSGVIVHGGSMGRIGGDEMQKADLELGAPGTIMPAQGDIQRVLGDVVRASKISAMIVGPDSRIRGSLVVAMGDADAATSEAGRAWFDLGEAAGEGPITLYRIDDKLGLVPVE